MKKRSLSLFLALLMVFGSVLPVFATESAPEVVAEEQTPTGVDAFYALYVPGATFNWMAYHAEEGATDLEGANGAVLSVTPNDGGSAAYKNGYLRLVDGQLTASDVYENATGNYTTEMIYATYDAQRDRTYTANFATLDAPIFAQKVENVFNVWTASTDITFTDAEGKALQEEWAKAYLLANNNETLLAASWFPISEAHYNAAKKASGFTVRVVGGTSGNEPFADYSMTSYEAIGSTYNSILGAGSSIQWKRYYHGYNYVSQQYEGMADEYYGFGVADYVKPGIGNSYVMKSEVDVLGFGNVASLTKDFENWGPELGNWSRYDFGVMTSHTWEETYANGTYAFTEYGDDTKANTATDTSGSVSVTPSTDFVVNGFDADYYAIRIYPFLLDAAQKAQNHFADLANYVKIANVDAFLTLSEASQQAIYTKFAETTFADADKDVIEATIAVAVEEELMDDLPEEYANHVAKYEKLAGLYVSGATTLWSAYGAKDYNGSTIGVISNGAELTYVKNEGGSAAYDDGFLRVINGKLQLTGAYANTTGEYTTEMIYATYDAERERNYTANFATLDAPIFAEKVDNVFTVWGMNEDLSFTDAKGKDMQERWAKAYLIANNNEEYRATAWFPISENHYNQALGAGMNVRKVGGTSGNEPFADYSMSGYEASADAYGSVLSAGSTTQWKRYYHGYYYVSEQHTGIADEYDWLVDRYGNKDDYKRPGIGNSYVMKSEFALNGTDTNYAEKVGEYRLVTDFSAWGPVDGGNWSRYDFGVVTSHTWAETVTDAGKYKFSAYGDSQKTLYIPTVDKVELSTDFIVNGFDADYYAIRIYPFMLNDAAKAQNHFVDLISYHDIDIEYVEMFEDLANKTALYEAFASTMVKDTSKADLENAIVAAFLGTTSTALVDTYVQFLGYQVKVNGDPGLRSVFEVHQSGTIANATLVEVGAIMAIKGDRTVADLTVAKNAEEYVAVGAQMMNAAVYKNGAWAEENLYENGGTTTFGYTCLFDDLVQEDPENEMAPADKLQTELLFRGYVVIEVNGVECVFYTDMTSDTFGDSVSMYELSKSDEFKGFATSQNVIDIVEPASEEEGATEVEG